jgi:amino acid adenylation domain-containing protein
MTQVSPVPPSLTNLAQLFESQARAAPDAVAVLGPAGSLTYAQLDAAAEGVARKLRAIGVGPNVIVGICVERSPEMAVGLLGILKAGGACMPLDPSYPTERLAFMLSDASPVVVATQQRLLSRMPQYPGNLLCLDTGEELAARVEWTREAPPPAEAGAAPQPPDRDDRLAYVIYTSGSTGTPNGVLLGHKGLINHCRAAASIYGLSPSDRVLQFCSISFDVCIEELFPTWARGATSVLRPDDLAVLGRPWLEWVRSQEITVCNLPTAYWHQWVRDLESLGERLPASIRVVVVGGEKAHGRSYRAWLGVGGNQARWFNAYGPTEASVMATIHEAAGDGTTGAEDCDPPIGRPLPNMNVHILDPKGQPVAAGESGELYIGGMGLAWGYLNRPELTARRFVPDPFSTAPPTRLYRTGDIVRMLANGELDFVGRADDQVKVRGFRIECGEVEAALRSHPAVREAVVIAREDAPGDRRLVAYVVAEEGHTPRRAELRRWLAARLPAYMLPGAFIELGTLPLTGNGKLDRSALPRPGTSPTGATPGTATEKALSAIWSDLLGIETPGTEDNFFDLGGHSLVAAQVLARIAEDLGVALPLQTIFEAPTLAGLASIVEAQRGEEPDSVPPPLLAHPRPLAAKLPLSLAQEQMWAVQNRSGTRVDNNVTATLRLPAPVDPETLGSALAHLVDRHEALRTSFPIEHERPYQSIAPRVGVQVGHTDLSGLPPERRPATTTELVRAQDSAPFELGKAPLFRFGLISLGDPDDLVALTFDHMVCDGPSAYILLSELEEAYSALAAGRHPTLRPLPLQYADFALWERDWLTEARLEAQLGYWERVLAGMPLGPALPFDRTPETPTRRIASRSLAFGPGTRKAMEELARSRRASVLIVCVAAVSTALGSLGGSDDVVLSTTLSGRQRAEVEGMVGNLAAMGRLRVSLAGDPSFAMVVARARDAVLGLFDHGDIPFFRVRDALGPDFAQRSGGRPPLALLPTELQYFRASHDHWSPGWGVVEQPPSTPAGFVTTLDRPRGELFFRGQLHPLSITLFDDGTQLWGEASYKTDFYEAQTIERLAQCLDHLVALVTADPSAQLSALRSAAAGC